MVKLLLVVFGLYLLPIILDAFQRGVLASIVILSLNRGFLLILSLYRGAWWAGWCGAWAKCDALAGSRLSL